MKFLFTIITAFVLFFQTGTLQSLRDFFPKASDSKENAEKFAEMSNSVNSTDPAAKAYKAAALVIKSKFETGANRRTLITNGIKSLENTVAVYPKNIEVRVIRMSLQENLPKIVGYSADIKEDKSFITNNYASQNAAMKQYVRGFVNHSKSFSATERAAFK